MEERASDSPRDFQHDFTGAQVAGVLAISVLGGCFPALQPILLGALEAAGRIDAALVGRVATVEAISMAISAVSMVP